jgi:hypothetical protein
MEPLGLGLGVLMGVISGTCLILLLRTKLAGGASVKSTLTITSELLAIPSRESGACLI